MTQAEAIEALARLVARGGLMVLSVEPKRRQALRERDRPAMMT